MLKRTPLLILKNYNVGFIIVKRFFEKGSIFGGFGQTFTLATSFPVDEATIVSTPDATDDRFKAGFKAALLALVDEEGNALLTESDEEAIRAASFLPIMRVFNAGLSLREENAPIDTAKKN